MWGCLAVGVSKPLLVGFNKKPWSQNRNRNPRTAESVAVGVAKSQPVGVEEKSDTVGCLVRLVLEGSNRKKAKNKLGGGGGGTTMFLGGRGKETTFFLGEGVPLKRKHSYDP